MARGLRFLRLLLFVNIIRDATEADSGGAVHPFRKHQQRVAAHTHTLRTSG